MRVLVVDVVGLLEATISGPFPVPGIMEPMGNAKRRLPALTDRPASGIGLV